MLKNVFAISFVTLLSACAATNAPMPKSDFSPGGELLVMTRISNERTLKQFAEAQQQAAVLAAVSS